ncbi:MAG: response regulator [Terriglobales bacterium]
MKKRKYRILVVDDESSVLFTYRVLLEQNGYTTTAVLSSREAIDAVTREEFDLLLCDLSLEEGHTGFEVLEQARKTNPAIPCVLLTGYASSDATQRAEQLGIPVLYKPIEIKEFLDTIPLVLRKRYEQTAPDERAHRPEAS